MLRFLPLVLLALAPLLATPEAAAQDTRYASTSLRLRTGPGTGHDVLVTIPRGQAVTVSNCTNWCAASYAGQTGYVSARYLSSTAPREAPSYDRPSTRRSGVTSGTYVNSRGNRVQRPVRADRAPSGASAQCRNGTYSFSQSRRGTCSRHGGVAVWL